VVPLLGWVGVPTTCRMLTWEHFKRAAGIFVKRSKVLGDPWEWKAPLEQDKDRPGFGYLVKAHQIREIQPKAPNVGDDAAAVGQQEGWDIGLEEKGLETSDLSTENTRHSSKEKCHIYEYHIVYSTSYQVPVMLFNGYHLDGRYLNFDEIWDDVPPRYKNEEIKWSFITQKDHPVLGVPFYHVHPCHTSKLMSVVSTNIQSNPLVREDTYLLSWLSLVGPVVGLQLSFRWFKNT